MFKVEIVFTSDTPRKYVPCGSRSVNHEYHELTCCISQYLRAESQRQHLDVCARLWAQRWKGRAAVSPQERLSSQIPVDNDTVFLWHWTISSSHVLQVCDRYLSNAALINIGSHEQRLAGINHDGGGKRRGREVFAVGLWHQDVSWGDGRKNTQHDTSCLDRCRFHPHWIPSYMYSIVSPFQDIVGPRTSTPQWSHGQWKLNVMYFITAAKEVLFLTAFYLSACLFVLNVILLKCTQYVIFGENWYIGKISLNHDHTSYPTQSFTEKSYRHWDRGSTVMSQNFIWIGSRWWIVKKSLSSTTQVFTVLIWFWQKALRMYNMMLGGDLGGLRCQSALIVVLYCIYL